MRRPDRPAPTKEPRTCQRCGASFTWSSIHPKQNTCSKLCYMALYGQKPKTDAQRLRRNELARERRDARQLQRFGLTNVEYEAGRRGACEICGRTGELLNLDHCHSTERFRGFLCTGCNQGLGKFTDDPAVLRAAADYLDRIRIS